MQITEVLQFIGMGIMLLSATIGNNDRLLAIGVIIGAILSLPGIIREIRSAR